MHDCRACEHPAEDTYDTDWRSSAISAANAEWRNDTGYVRHSLTYFYCVRCTPHPGPLPRLMLLENSTRFARERGTLLWDWFRGCRFARLAAVLCDPVGGDDSWC